MSLPAALPDKFDPSHPLSDPRYERFAQLRVIGVGAKEAASEAGLPVTHRNAPRYDRHPEIVARKAYLAKDDADVVAATRLFIRDRLLQSATLNVLADFAIIGNVEVGGKKVPRIVGIDWRKLKNSEQAAAVTGFKFDRESGVMVEFTRDDPLQAISQLRDMYGFRAARKKELSGPNGGPIQSEDVTAYTDDELLELEAIQLAVRARRSVTGPDQGGD